MENINTKYILLLGVGNHAHASASSSMGKSEFWASVQAVADVCNSLHVVPYIRVRKETKTDLIGFDEKPIVTGYSFSVASDWSATETLNEFIIRKCKKYKFLHLL